MTQLQLQKKLPICTAAVCDKKGYFPPFFFLLFQHLFTNHSTVLCNINYVIFCKVISAFATVCTNNSLVPDNQVHGKSQEKMLHLKNTLTLPAVETKIQINNHPIN